MKTYYVIRHSWLPEKTKGGFLSWPEGVPAPRCHRPLKFVSDLADATQFATLEQAQETLQIHAYQTRGWIGSLTFERVVESVGGRYEVSLFDAALSNCPIALKWKQYTNEFGRLILAGDPDADSTVRTGWIKAVPLAEADLFNSVDDAMAAILRRNQWQLTHNVLPLDNPFTLVGVRVNHDITARVTVA